MAKTRKLKDIETREVSLVGKPANMRPFLFHKQEDSTKESQSKQAKKLKTKLNIVIDSDGTVSGTKIVVNKEEIENMRDFSFSFWSNSDMNPVSCSYSKFVETDDGFSRSETFYLTKGNLKMDKKTIELLKAYLGLDEIKVEDLKQNPEDINKAMSLINEYRADFPDDLKDAVGVIAKSIAPVEKADEKKDTKEKDDVEKAGAKLSKDTLKKLTDALSALKSLIPEVKSKTEKSDDSEDKQDEVTKALEDLVKSVEDIEKKQTDATESEALSLLKDLGKRLKVVEKASGGKKSIDGQDDDEDDVEKGEKLWPSVSVDY